MIHQTIRDRYITVVLAIFGSYSTVIGLFMMVAPREFFESLGAFGIRNDHYIFDAASFELPMGLLLWAAIWLQSWRRPALIYATAHWALHAVSHGIDTDHADGQAVGLAEFGGLVLGTTALIAAVFAVRRRDGVGCKETR